MSDDDVQRLAEVLADLSWAGRQLSEPHALALAAHVYRSGLVVPV